MKQRLTRILGPIIILATIAGFIWYARANPAVVTQLKETPLAAIVLILLGYTVIFGALMGVLYASLRMYRRHMGVIENFQLSSYSSLANFFGPGQSGPAVRGAYLKLKHGVGIKQYVFATLVYYGFYATLSGLIILGFAFPWWVTLLGGLVTISLSILVILWFLRRNQGLIGDASSRKALLKPFIIMGIFTSLQVLLLVFVYFIELRAVDASITLVQSLIYTGAANFALFVSLTPGAIGFREAFLLFSQNLHGISSDTIIAANILDRAVYLVFLGLLFIVVLATHATSRLQIAQLKKRIATDTQKGTDT